MSWSNSNDHQFSPLNFVTFQSRHTKKIYLWKTSRKYFLVFLQRFISPQQQLHKVLVFVHCEFIVRVCTLQHIARPSHRTVPWPFWSPHMSRGFLLFVVAGHHGQHCCLVSAVVRGATAMSSRLCGASLTWWHSGRPDGAEHTNHNTLSCWLFTSLIYLCFTLYLTDGIWKSLKSEIINGKIKCQREKKRWNKWMRNGLINRL